MKYRKHDWLNTKTMQPEHGIQAKHPETGKWMHCAEGSKPLIYKTEAERDAQLDELLATGKVEGLGSIVCVECQDEAMEEESD